jgi:hypothetical protein
MRERLQISSKLNAAGNARQFLQAGHVKSDWPSIEPSFWPLPQTVRNDRFWHNFAHALGGTFGGR